MSETELAERLETLERDNRRLKCGGLALLVILVALTTIYATRPVPDVIKAHEFDLVNNQEKVTAELGVPPQDLPQVSVNAQGKLEVSRPTYPNIPQLSFYDSSGKRVTEVSRNGFLAKGNGKTEVVITANSFNYANVQGHAIPQAAVSVVDGANQTTLESDADGARLVLDDQQGYDAVVGNTKITWSTGQTQQTSVDSIVFANYKDQRVSWSTDLLQKQIALLQGKVSDLESGAGQADLLNVQNGLSDLKDKLSNFEDGACPVLAKAVGGLDNGPAQLLMACTAHNPVF